MMNSITMRTIAVGVAFLFSTIAFAQKKKVDSKNKFLEGKKYDVLFYEIKPAGRGKSEPSMIMIKNGLIMCDFTEDKISLPPIQYKVTLDSTYTEDDSEIRMISFEAEYAEDKSEFMWEAIVTNYDIEGTCVQMRSGVEKKRFEFNGSEKAKKK